MLKKIDVTDLTVGMHLHALCGSWVDHPFWKTKFVLHDPADLAKLRGSGVTECWIDVAKGLDVAAPPVPAAAPAERAPAGSTVAAPSVSSAAAAVPGVSFDEELGRAAALISQSRRLVVSMFQEARLGRAIDTARCLPVVGEIAESVSRNPGALVSLARLKAHDDYSYMHSVAVSGLMAALARHFGSSEAQVLDAGLAGLLHDVGKMRVPLAVLNKPGRLTDAEYAVVRQHPLLGHELLQGSDEMPAAALDVCLHHHERPDGKGYPHGLRADAISPVAKMGAICDVYDAITSNRPYHAGGDPSESLARMADWTKAGQFDQATFLGFLKVLGVYPVGSLVRMRSGRLAVVVEQNPKALLTPRVKVFYSTRAQMPVPVELLDTAASACGDAIVARESNAVWKFSHLDELWAGRDVLARAARAGP